MYFSEAPQIDIQELGERSLDTLQQHYGDPGAYYTVRHSLPIIADVLPNDDTLSTYLQDFHTNARIASCLQLRDERPAVSAALAESLQNEDPAADTSIYSVHELAHIQNPAQPLPGDISHLTRMEAYDLTWPTWKYDRTAPFTGQAAVALVCGKQTAPEPSEALLNLELRQAPELSPPSAHMPILTAPENMAQAYNLLRESPQLYLRGAISISGALARADQAKLWDAFQESAKSDLSQEPHEPHRARQFETLSLIAGIGMAMRAKRYDAAHNMAVRSRELGELTPETLRALCTIVSLSQRS
jgi:hypothetical protein